MNSLWSIDAKIIGALFSIIAYTLDFHLFYWLFNIGHKCANHCITSVSFRSVLCSTVNHWLASRSTGVRKHQSYYWCTMVHSGRDVPGSVQVYSKRSLFYRVMVMSLVIEKHSLSWCEGCGCCVELLIKTKTVSRVRSYLFSNCENYLDNSGFLTPFCLDRCH